MTKLKKLPITLGFKMFFTLLFAVLCAVIVWYSVFSIGGSIVDKRYMSADSVSQRRKQIITEFSSYVNSNFISGTDSAALMRWNSSHDLITIYVYSTGSDSGYSGFQNRPQNAVGRVASEEQYDGSYGELTNIRFSDGIYKIAVSDDTQTRQYALWRAAAFVLAGVTLIVIVLIYVSRLTERIIRLSQSAAVLGSGDLEHEIVCEGEDELSRLGRKMESMRQSVVEKIGSEHSAWEANAELITAISHDIRTPMTAILGYLSLIKESGGEDSEKVEHYSSAAYTKALELKDLTDELFRYFLIYGKSDLQLNTERLDAGMLLGQLLAEAVYDISEAGIHVQQIGSCDEGFVEADPLYLKRVFDNMVSNIKKYADSSRPVLALIEAADGRVSVCISNYIRKSMKKVESTKIGLQTCGKIMEKMNGSFVTSADGDHFAAELILPLLPPLGY